jgi:hypothetical protein
MNRIPKYVFSILEKRAKAAKLFMKYDSELVNWMEKHHMDTNSPSLQDHIHGGCVSVVEPEASKKTIINFLDKTKDT